MSDAGTNDHLSTSDRSEAELLEEGLEELSQERDEEQT